MEKLQIFKNEEFGEIRTVVVNEEPWFVGKDVAVALGYSNASKAVSTHVDSEDRILKMLEVADSQNGNVVKTQTSLINESGVYALIFGSKLPTAKKFKRWVTSEVLPSIRKTGGYINPQNMSPAEQIKLIANGYVEMSEKIESVEKELIDFKNDMPLLGVEETKITTAVRSKGVRVLGGKDSNAYADKSLRRRVFSDIYRELKRQFQVGTYKAIKRSQCEVALGIINDYEPPLALEEEIRDCNAQESFVPEIA